MYNNLNWFTPLFPRHFRRRIFIVRCSNIKLKEWRVTTQRFRCIWVFLTTLVGCMIGDLILTSISSMSKVGFISFSALTIHFPVSPFFPMGGPGHMQCAAVRTQNLLISTPPHFPSSCIGNSMSTYQGMWPARHPPTILSLGSESIKYDNDFRCVQHPVTLHTNSVFQWVRGSDPSGEKRLPLPPPSIRADVSQCLSISSVTFRFPHSQPIVNSRLPLQGKSLGITFKISSLNSKCFGDRKSH